MHNLTEDAIKSIDCNVVCASQFSQNPGIHKTHSVLNYNPVTFLSVPVSEMQKATPQGGFRLVWFAALRPP